MCQRSLISILVLRLASQLASIPNPYKSQLETLQNWIHRKDGGNGFLAETGFEGLIWSEDRPEQYACPMAGKEETDIFTDFIKTVMSLLWHKIFGRRMKKRIIDQRTNMVSYDDAKLHMASDIFALVISSILPVATIFALNQVDTTNKRLGLTVVFTALFAIFLGLFKSAKRAAMFAATAT
jgi:hypothetical protein